MGVLRQAGLVAAGSAAGGLTRWGVATLFAAWLGTAWPWGTWFINVSGCLFLGWFLTRLAERLPPWEGSRLRAEDLRLLVAVGFTGAYTTFSTFEVEAHGLLGDGDGLGGTAYLFLSVLAGLLAVRAGVRLARRSNAAQPPGRDHG